MHVGYGLLTVPASVISLVLIKTKSVRPTLDHTIIHRRHRSGSRPSRPVRGPPGISCAGGTKQRLSKWHVGVTAR